MEEVKRLAAENRFDHLLIEGTGIAEPLPVGATFSFRDEAGFSLSDVARLDTMATVVDAMEYGISSFAYRARRPFDPVRFDAFVKDTWPGLIRAKGHFRLATRPEWVGEFSLAGAVARVSGLGRWWVTVPKERWPDVSRWRELVGGHWSPVWGDRRQEIVFIGRTMDETAIRAALDACLVGADDSAFEAARYRGLPDPFPRWSTAA